MASSLERKQGRRDQRRCVERGEGRQRGGKWGQEGAGRSVGVPTGGAKPTRGGETDGGAASQAPAKLELEEG